MSTSPKRAVLFACIHSKSVNVSDMLASHTADIDVDKEMVAAFCEYDTACAGRLDLKTFREVICMCSRSLFGWTF
jgi:hypothetical protein